MKFYLLCVTAGLFCLAVCVSETEAQWHYLPAGRAEVDAIVADTAGERMLISTPGGCWLTENAGETWSPLGDHLDFDTRYGQGTFQVFDPYAGNIFAQIYVNPRVNGVDRLNLMSSNGGQTWTLPPGLGTRQGILQPWKRDRNVWFNVVNDFSISTDGGVNWQVRSTLPIVSSYPLWLFQDWQNDSTVFVLSTYQGNYDPDRGGVLRSDDLGLTWRSLIDFNQDFGVNDRTVPVGLIRLSSGRLLVTQQGGSTQLNRAVLISDDDGESWDSVGAPVGYIYGNIVESVLVPGRILASANCSSGLIISDDYGETWRAGALGLDSDRTYGGLLQQSADGDLYFSQGYGPLHKSLDGGSSWQRVEQLSMAGTFLDQWYGFDRYQQERVFDVLPEGNFKIVKMGNTRAPVYAGWELPDGQNSWREIQQVPVVGDTLASILTILDRQADTLAALAYRISYSGPLWSGVARVISTDQGITWAYREPGPPIQQTIFDETVISSFRSEQTERIIMKFYNSRGYSDDSLVISTDRGQHWTGIAWPVYMQYSNDFDVAQSDADFAILLRGRHLFRSADNGMTFDTLATLSGYCKRVLAVGTEYMVASDDSLYTVENGAMISTGVLPESDLGNDEIAEFAVIPGVEPLIVFRHAVSQPIWTSTDRGRSWMQHDLQFPFERQYYDVIGLTYDPYRERLWLSTGIGPCYLETSQLLTTEPIHLFPADFDLLSVFPNPFNNEATIRYELLRESRVQIELYDITGRLTKALADQVAVAGKHEIKLDARELASGIYFVSIAAGDLRQTEKIVLLK